MKTQEENKEKVQMKTTVECMAALNKRGFTINFLVKDMRMCIPESNKCYTPDQVSIVDFYRFEGESDPADSSILYAIETYDGHKGMVSDSYGANADTLITKFFHDVEEISKQRVTANA